MQVATILKCFSMGDELVRAAALLFTRAADLEENIDSLTDVMQVCVLCVCVLCLCVHVCAHACVLA